MALFEALLLGEPLEVELAEALLEALLEAPPPGCRTFPIDMPVSASQKQLLRAQ